MPDNNPAGAAAPVQTFDEMIAEITSTTTRLEELNGRLTTAQNDYQTKTEKWFYPDEESRNQARKALLPELEPVEQEAIGLSQALGLNIRNIFEQTKTEAASLSDAEMASASAKREFVKEDYSTLTLDQLVKKVQASINQGDKPEMWLHLRYGKLRLAQAGDAWNDNPTARNDLTRLLGEVEQKLTTGKAKEVNSKALAALSKAQDVERAARKRALGNQTFAFQSAGDVPW